jgi:hypothetical protein
MTAAAATIRAFRDRAAALDRQMRTLPVWGLDPEAQTYWEADGAVYRIKDYITDESYSWRYTRAADWLESRASGATLAALYPHITIR